MPPVESERGGDRAERSRGSPLPGVDQAGIVGEYHGLDSVPQFQLGQEMGDVGLDRGRADIQVGRHFGVGVSTGHQAQHVHLPVRGQRSEAGDRPACGRGCQEPSPAATTRTPSASRSTGASLSRKPLAPVRSAAKHELVEVERGQDGHSGGQVGSGRLAVAAMPSSTGMPRPNRSEVPLHAVGAEKAYGGRVALDPGG
jgi:hypothetical protein